MKLETIPHGGAELRHHARTSITKFYDLAPTEKRIFEYYTSGQALVDTLEQALTAPPTWRERIRQFFCGMRGHDRTLHFEGRRVMMRCSSCGHDTPGWEVNGRAPRRRYEGDAARHEIKR